MLTGIGCFVITQAMTGNALYAAVSLQPVLTLFVALTRDMFRAQTRLEVEVRFVPLPQLNEAEFE